MKRLVFQAVALLLALGALAFVVVNSSRSSGQPLTGEVRDHRAEVPAGRAATERHFLPSSKFSKVFGPTKRADPQGTPSEAAAHPAR